MTVTLSVRKQVSITAISLMMLGQWKGALTASVATVLGSSNKIYTAYYYDIKGRVAKTVQSNLLGAMM